jgi:CRP-like cAMP-binding protein
METKYENISFFSSFTQEEQKSLYSLLKEENFSKNQTIFQKGDYGNKMYFIKTGKIKIFDIKTGLTRKIAETFSVHKNEEEITTIFDGDFFGEMALISEKPRLFSAKAVEDSVIYSINKVDLKQLLNSNFDAEKIIAETFVKRILENNQ